MLRKFFFMLAAIAALISPTTASSDPAPSGYFINLDLIRQIICVGPDDEHKGQIAVYSGTSEYIGKNKWLTASHVVHGMFRCSIDDQRIKIVEDNSKLDYAVVAISQPKKNSLPVEHLNVACEPFHKGEHYYAVGYALGQDFVVQRLIGSSDVDEEDGFQDEALLVGKSYEGMSGGPIFDDQGFVVGIVNGGDSAGRASMDSRSLVGTSLCR